MATLGLLTRQTTSAPRNAALLLALVASVVRPAEAQDSRRLLIVVAHPDDEYAVSASTYRLVRELGWTADQVVITNGEGGYRYSALAEALYGVPLVDEASGRNHLPHIRKEEVIRAGKILGIREHHFLEQKDMGFGTDSSVADYGNWDKPRILNFLADLMARERYDVIFTLLPSPDAHAHHRAATLLTLEAVSRLPQNARPIVLGAEPRAKAEPPATFAGLNSEPRTRTVAAAPIVEFDRSTAFGYRNALNYQIVVNWVIAEHKSQGLFQTDSGRHEFEQFWLFDTQTGDADLKLERLQRQLSGLVRHASAR